MPTETCMFIFVAETALASLSSENMKRLTLASRVTRANVWVSLYLYFSLVLCGIFQAGRLCHYICTNVLDNLTGSCIFLMDNKTKDV